MNRSSKHREHFQQLMKRLKADVEKLRNNNRELHKENLLLKAKLEELEREQNDIFSSVSETERIAMKHQIEGLIAKLNQHLEG